MAYLIMASSDVDGLPAWLVPAAGGLRRVFVRSFLAAVQDDVRPHLAQVARHRLTDPNVRPSEAARLRRLAGLAATEPGAEQAAAGPGAQKPPHLPGGHS